MCVEALGIIKTVWNCDRFLQAHVSNGCRKCVYGIATCFHWRVRNPRTELPGRQNPPLSLNLRLDSSIIQPSSPHPPFQFAVRYDNRGVRLKDNGVEIRKLDSGLRVREDERTQFVYVDKVRSPQVLQGGVHPALGQVLRLSCMLKNEPFDKLHLPYRLVQQYGRHPSRLCLSFTIREEYVGFHRVALKEGLTGTMDISRMIHVSGLAEWVLGHLDKLCGLPPEESMIIG